MLSSDHHCMVSELLCRGMDLCLGASSRNEMCKGGGKAGIGSSGWSSDSREQHGSEFRGLT